MDGQIHPGKVTNSGRSRGSVGFGVTRLSFVNRRSQMGRIRLDRPPKIVPDRDRPTRWFDRYFFKGRSKTPAFNSAWEG
ncbi:hypothetical protein [Lyngbya sp. CCY1209]|uniref:hypothetical protein n=1 Tax=Lyngbya sp. CCY1209 TaxID=2886103 RepID=UPI002D214CE7|nr:hypothetical protein [Lyngbya sp. CCY1209]MEB3885244.1 hypothetical protein [Lyngbya sp. CCY1209]